MMWLDNYQAAGFASGNPRWRHRVARFVVRLSPRVWWTVRRANKRWREADHS